MLVSRFVRVLFLLAAWLCATGAAAYAARPDVDEFIDRMVQQHGFEREPLRQLLSGVERQESILTAIARPAEKTKPWKDYRKIFLDEQRISRGVEFWMAHRATLERAHRTYGVHPRVVVAILGVETRFGQVMGRYRVLDALSTLAFDYPPRAPFFRKELEQFLLLAREEALNPAQPVGSYAGAMGYGQFMPSSFRNYAVDFDGDGKRDIWTNIDDAIGSVAHYFQAHGWQDGAPVVVPAMVNGDVPPTLFEGRKPETSVAELNRAGVSPRMALDPALKAIPLRLEGDDGLEYWLGLNNFYVITRYNTSKLYAMAVHQLGETIERRMQ